MQFQLSWPAMAGPQLDSSKLQRQDSRSAGESPDSEKLSELGGGDREGVGTWNRCCQLCIPVGPA